MNSLTRFWWGSCIGFLLVMLLVATQPVAFAEAGPASGGGIVPTEVAGNPTCSDLDGGVFEIKVEPVSSGDHSGTFEGDTVTINVTVKNGTFDWSVVSGGVVNSVFVKGGDGGNLYVYNPAATGDTGLHAPINPKNGKFYGLSHISFCVTPGVPSIEVTKTCAEQTINGTVVTTRNTVILTNDGTLDLTGIQIREDTLATCSLTKVNGVDVADVALTMGVYQTVPDNGVDFDGNLVQGASVDVEVTCTGNALNVANTISGKGNSTGGPAEDDGTSAPANQCNLNPNPLVSIDKTCLAPSDIRLMAMGGELVVEVCPTIIVKNESGADPLTTAFVSDDQIPLLAGVGVDVIALRGEGPLLAGDEINVGDLVDLCYLPEVPVVAAFDDNDTPLDPSDDKYLPSDAGFLNTATVLATGFFGGVDPTDTDDTQVFELDENDIPVLVSECPLCPTPDGD